VEQKTINRKLLALCSAAVVCVTSYSTIASTAPVTAHASTKPTHHAVFTTSTKKKSTSTKSSTKPSTTAPVKQKYKDGTYTGIGETRIGAVQVAITLKKDKMVNVQITGHTTHYRISYIDPILPKELMKTQNINKIDVVSGATLSTEDFYYAVVDALNQAQQAEHK
jgi:uncharacterized protein with FMN-binding domain